MKYTQQITDLCSRVEYFFKDNLPVTYGYKDAEFANFISSYIKETIKNKVDTQCACHIYNNTLILTSFVGGDTEFTKVYQFNEEFFNNFINHNDMIYFNLHETTIGIEFDMQKEFPNIFTDIKKNFGYLGMFRIVHTGACPPSAVLLH